MKREADTDAEMPAIKRQKAEVFFSEEEFQEYVRRLTAPARKTKSRRRFLTCKDALMEGCTYSVVEVEQLCFSKQKTTLITLESLVTGIQHTVFSPQGLSKHVLTDGELDAKKVAMFRRMLITYRGLSTEVNYIKYKFDFTY